jgi:hypothetical protein
MNQMRRILPVLAVMLSSCDLGKCIYEVRTLEASGQIIGAASDSIGANVNLSEQRDSDPSKDLYFIISASSLKGHVTSAELKDAADPTRVLLTLPLAPPDRPVIAESAVSTRADANLNGYWEIFSANRGVIELRTDLPGRSLITIPLTVTSKTNWTRPQCS